MCAGPAQVEARQRGPVAGPAGRGPHEQLLVEPHLPVVDVPAREAEPRVIETLRTAGIAVEDARVIEPSLEDIFVSLLSRTA